MSLGDNYPYRKRVKTWRSNKKFLLKLLIALVSPIVLLGVKFSTGYALDPDLISSVQDIFSDLQYAVVVNDTLFFSADDETHGLELWQSDGTAAGTVLVKDIRPGPDGSNISETVTISNTLFFRANDGVHGAELWKSNGTPAGTVLVKDIWPGPDDSDLSGIAVVNDILFFNASDGVHGAELWKSDGSAAGTVLVKDIWPHSISRPVSHLTAMNNTLFFRANDGVHGAELWKSDGTDLGTALVKDINLDSSSSLRDAPFAVISDTLFFRADDAVHGSELWKSDGTDLGTVLVKDIWPGPTSSTNDLPFAVVNDTLFFRADDAVHGSELWKSDGTDLGTVLVKDIWPGPTSSSLTNSEIGPITNLMQLWYTPVHNTLFLAANDGVNELELWKSDGTDAGTVLVKDIWPGPDGSGFTTELYTSYILSQVDLNGTLYFSATDGTHGIELWKSDGTDAGTVLVADIWPGPGSRGPAHLTAVNDILFFTAADGTNESPLWALKFATNFVYLPVITK